MTPDSCRLARLLLIDDSPAEVLLVESMLERESIHLDFDALLNGEEALPHLAAKAQDEVLPDIILLDLNMPQVHGLEVLTTLKKNRQYQHIPIIMYSGSEADCDKEKAEQMGAMGYMLKTVNKEKLRQAITGIQHVRLKAEADELYLYRL